MLTQVAFATAVFLVFLSPLMYSEIIQLQSTEVSKRYEQTSVEIYTCES